MAQSTSDAKLRAGVKAKVDITQPVRLDLEHEERLGGIDGFEKSITEAGLRVEVHKMLRLGGAYRLSITDGDGIWHRASGDATASYDIAALSVAYRLMFQSSFRPDETVSSLRNKIGASYELNKRLEPFAALEVHYSTTDAEFRETRLILGSEVRLSKRIDLDAYYMYQDEFNKRIAEKNHILGVSLSFRLRSVDKKDSDRDEPLEASQSIDTNAPPI